jgi:hypothetical protein
MSNWGPRPPGNSYGQQPQVQQPQQAYLTPQQQQYLAQQQRYQYAQQRPQQQIDPRYVGPQWAAPGPRQQIQQPKKSGNGCLIALLFVFIGIPALLFVLGFGIAIIAAIVNGDDGTTTTTTPEDDKPITLPDTHALTPIPSDKKATAEEEHAWESGFCGDFSKERDRTEYLATRNEGSAKVLRGKVALLNIHMFSPTLKWTKTSDSDATQAALLAQRFVLEEAARYKVTDLQFDVIPWSLNTTLDLPGLNTNTADLLTVDTMRFIRDSARQAVEVALGTHLESVVTDLRKSGYEQVGFIIYFPVTTEARDFAFMAYNTQPKDDPELGFIFTPVGKSAAAEFGHLSVTVAHEAMHLFGADDLYRIEHIDKTDTHDLMGEYCSGYKQATLLDATAYAIGWITTPPPRPYPFVDR